MNTKILYQNLEIRGKISRMVFGLWAEYIVNREVFSEHAGVWKDVFHENK